MRVIAILDKSTGNETVGEMWKETRSFDADTPVIEILKWATGYYGELTKTYRNNPESFRGNLTITVDQATTETAKEGK